MQSWPRIQGCFNAVLKGSVYSMEHAFEMLTFVNGFDFSLAFYSKFQSDLL